MSAYMKDGLEAADSVRYFVQILREDQTRRLLDRLKREFPQFVRHCENVREIGEEETIRERRA